MTITEEELMVMKDLEWVIEEHDKLIKISERMEPLRKLLENPNDRPEEFVRELNVEVQKFEDVFKDPSMVKYAKVISCLPSISHESFLKHLSSPKDLFGFVKNNYNSMFPSINRDLIYDRVITTTVKKRYSSAIPIQEG